MSACAMGKRSLKRFDKNRDYRHSFYIPCEKGMIESHDRKWCAPRCIRRYRNGNCKKWKKPIDYLDPDNAQDLIKIRGMILINERLVF